MPCLNEAETLGICVKKALKALEEHKINGEVLIADNGSTDGSQELARKLGARVVDISQKGYGNALMGGIDAAQGKYVIMGDSDDSYDFGEAPNFLAKLRDGYDLVMGNRFKGGILPGAMPFKNRYLGNPGITAIGRLFFGSPCGDFYCGLRGFSKAAYERLDLRSTGMEFAIEMVVKSTLHKLRIGEIPVKLHPDGRGRPPHLRPWRDGWRTLRFYLMYSPRWLFLIPGFMAMLTGACGMGAIFFTDVLFNGVGFSIHTMFFAALAVIIGYQMVCFAVFTKLFAITEGFLPLDQRVESLFKVITLEVGLICGALLTLLGMAGACYAVWIWKETGFGPLDPTQGFRVIIPSGLALTLGIQTMLASFFISVLGLKRKRSAA